MDINKYNGVIPAFYACYDDNGNISPERTEKYTEWLISKGVKGIYVGGSSGECIYQGVEERKITLESAMKVAKGRITVIAHVACNNTRDSMELAAHAESLGVDAIAAIPPIYFKLPDHAIAKYWNDISSAAPNTDFIIYNIPQLAGTALTLPLLREMLKNPRVIGVKNSSLPAMDIQKFKYEGTLGGREFVVFNGPDEQFVSGIAIGADGGIGGTYSVMPELYVKLLEMIRNGEREKACALQHDLCNIIYKLCSGTGNMYALIKEVLRRREGLNVGGVRPPLTEVTESDDPIVNEAAAMIDAAVKKYL